MTTGGRGNGVLQRACDRPLVGDHPNYSRQRGQVVVKKPLCYWYGYRIADGDAAPGAGIIVVAFIILLLWEKKGKTKMPLQRPTLPFSFAFFFLSSLLFFKYNPFSSFHLFRPFAPNDLCVSRRAIDKMERKEKVQSRPGGGLQCSKKNKSFLLGGEGWAGGAGIGGGAIYLLALLLRQQQQQQQQQQHSVRLVRVQAKQGITGPSAAVFWYWGTWDLL